MNGEFGVLGVVLDVAEPSLAAPCQTGFGGSEEEGIVNKVILKPLVDFFGRPFMILFGHGSRKASGLLRSVFSCTGNAFLGETIRA